jgi:hypothetical protein
VNITAKSWVPVQPSRFSNRRDCLWSDGEGCNAGDLFFSYNFASGRGPDQWICWDFGELRVHPTHYTIHGDILEPLVVEGSLDGTNWVEISRQAKKWPFNSWGRASLTTANTGDFRFIRLTVTDESSDRGANRYRVTRRVVRLHTVEFFGTLWE